MTFKLKLVADHARKLREQARMEIAPEIARRLLDRAEGFELAGRIFAPVSQRTEFVQSCYPHETSNPH